MSTWYIFSVLGFYPVAPASDHYALGSLLFDGATIQLPGGKEFKIIVKNQGDKNVYVQKAILNGQQLKQNFISHADIMIGGELVFLYERETGVMLRPDFDWCTNWYMLIQVVNFIIG